MLLSVAASFACRERPPGADAVAAVASAPGGDTGALAQLASTRRSAAELAAATDGAGARDAGVPPVITVQELRPEIPPDACPVDMVHVRGGEFWMGSPRGRGASEERPRFLTRVADFCMDRHEVTAADYASCVERGRCTLPPGKQSTCNYGRRGRHPINCVDWHQAEAFCTSRAARLPSELEWEYAARGGARYSPYSWGARGGSHVGRNQFGKGLGCKNRDVGVGWNSACCPSPTGHHAVP